MSEPRCDRDTESPKPKRIPEAQTLNPRNPYSPKPETPNPKSQTLNTKKTIPKPETPNPTKRLSEGLGATRGKMLRCVSTATALITHVKSSSGTLGFRV